MSEGYTKDRKFATVGMPGRVRLYMNYDDPRMYSEISLPVAIKYRNDINEAILATAGHAYLEMLENGEVKE